MTAQATGFAKRCIPIADVPMERSTPMDQLCHQAHELLIELRHNRAMPGSPASPRLHIDHMARVTGRSSIDAAIDEVTALLRVLEPCCPENPLPSGHANRS